MPSLRASSSRLTTHCDAQPYPTELAAPPPFTLQDLRNAIPKHCWEKNTWRSMAFLALDVAIVAAMAFVAFTVNNW